MAGVSGQYGSVQYGASSVHECTKWSLSRKASVKKYNSCATAGNKKAVAGTKEASGSIEGIYDPASPIENSFQNGDSVLLKLYTTASKYYQLTAVISNLELEVDIDDGDVIKWKADYEVDGAITGPV